MTTESLQWWQWAQVFPSTLWYKSVNVRLQSVHKVVNRKCNQNETSSLQCTVRAYILDSIGSLFIDVMAEFIAGVCITTSSDTATVCVAPGVAWMYSLYRVKYLGTLTSADSVLACTRILVLNWPGHFNIALLTNHGLFTRKLHLQLIVSFPTLTVFKHAILPDYS